LLHHHDHPLLLAGPACQHADLEDSLATALPPPPSSASYAMEEDHKLSMAGGVACFSGIYRRTKPRLP